MKLAGWKRAMLAGLLTLSVAGSSLAPLAAGHAAASAGGKDWGTDGPCYTCPNMN